MDFERNNLDKAHSPYLQQHKDNSIQLKGKEAKECYKGACRRLK